MDILGTYNGTYEYDKHPNAERLNTATMFTLIITYHEKTTFKGTITDDLESGGTPGEGIIEGTIKAGKIEFIKQMPTMTVTTNNGVRIEIPKKHNPIYYTGILKGETFEGIWKIKRRILFNKFIIGFGSGTYGTWKMSKK